MGSMRLTRDGGQIMEHNDPAMLVLSYTGRMANFADGVCLYHWHEDFGCFVSLRGCTPSAYRARQLGQEGR